MSTKNGVTDIAYLQHKPNKQNHVLRSVHILMTLDPKNLNELMFWVKKMHTNDRAISNVQWKPFQVGKLSRV